ncbi:calcium-binding protein [Paracoccus sp. (in: a-proteobacteria)]|uniref:calcium-binding protein n=1 Tax=Paracoccus sp. TaxID=267 RepID=UPI003220070E
MAVINGGAGNNTLRGTTGADTIGGHLGNDVLNGGRGNDRVDGGAGADILVWDQDPLSRGRLDVYLGGATEERYDSNIYSALSGGDRLVLNGSGAFRVGFTSTENGTAHDAWGNQLNFVGIERLQTGAGNDRIIASNAVLNPGRGSGDSHTPTHGITVNSGAGRDYIVGSRGSDVLDPGAGNDTVYGGGGLDLLMPSEGNDYGHAGAGDDNVRWGNNGSMGVIRNIGHDTLVGGDGFDLLNVWTKVSGDNSTGGTVVFTSTSAGRASFPQGNGTLVFSQFEQFWTHEGKDTIAGGNAVVGADGKGLHVNTRWGDDMITATRGHDTIEGGVGADTIDGRQGNDIISMCDGVFEGRNAQPDAERDVLIIRDGSGSDRILAFQAGDARGAGGSITRHSDALNVSALHDAQGNRVDVNDVRVTSQNGDAVLTFPNGERIVLEGVDAGIMDRAMLIKLGIPAAGAAAGRMAAPETAEPAAAAAPASRALPAAEADEFNWTAASPGATGELRELVATHDDQAARDLAPDAGAAPVNDFDWG